MKEPRFKARAMYRYIAAPLFGRPEHRAAYKAACAVAESSVHRLSDAMERFPQSDGDEGGGGSPIFILSAGWRSGSTLLQRIVCSNDNHRTLIWGEPYDLCGTVQRLSDSLLPISREWPPEDYFIESRELGGIRNEWIANLYPSLSSLRSSHRKFFTELLEVPAKRKGYDGWGFKEVRLGANEAVYLRWLFPDARFLFICRNPFDAYASYASRKRLWFASWPSQPMLTPTQFGMHWSRLAASFLEHDFGDKGLLVRYEDLVSAEFDFQPLESLLGYQIDRSVLKQRVGGSGNHTSGNVSRLERWLLRRALARPARELGYV